MQDGTRAHRDESRERQKEFSALFQHSQPPGGMVRKKFVSPESIITKPEKLVNLRLKKILQIQTDASSPALFSARSLDFRRGEGNGLLFC